ncbi:MAG: hypothetical protein H0X69_14880 [Gemmatimonadales bacterium]|nr:hypothetical protein [Gemmatimonadales bacterium]
MKLVLIEWVDSHRTDGWHELADERPDHATVARSVGWLVLDGQEVKIVAPHLMPDQPGVDLQAAGVMTIPVRAILAVRELTELTPEARATSPAS